MQHTNDQQGSSDVEFVSSRTCDEAVEERRKEAEARGDVVDLDADAPPVAPVAPVAPAPAADVDTDVDSDEDEDVPDEDFLNAIARPMGGGLFVTVNKKGKCVLLTHGKLKSKINACVHKIGGSQEQCTLTDARRKSIAKMHGGVRGRCRFHTKAFRENVAPCLEA